MLVSSCTPAKQDVNTYFQYWYTAVVALNLLYTMGFNSYEHDMSHLADCLLQCSDCKFSYVASECNFIHTGVYDFKFLI